MKWRTFGELLPEFDKPIFVYKRKTGIYGLFEDNDDIRVCRLREASRRGEGMSYVLGGYDYGSSHRVRFNEKEFFKMKWAYIPNPNE